MVKLQNTLEYAIHEAIWMTLESADQTSATLVDDLYEIAKGGPLGRAGAPAQNLHHFIKQLAADVVRAVEEEEAEQDSGLAYAENLHAMPEGS